MYFGDYNIGNRNSEINDNDLKDLIEKCLKDKNNRISWNDYFNHKFFNNIYSDYNEDDDVEIDEKDINLLEKYKNELKSFTETINGNYIKFHKERDRQEKRKLLKSQYDKLKKDYDKINILVSNIQDLYLNLNKK
jgi:hypothetical protein